MAVDFELESAAMVPGSVLTIADRLRLQVPSQFFTVYLSRQTLQGHLPVQELQVRFAYEYFSLGGGHHGERPLSQDCACGRDFLGAIVGSEVMVRPVPEFSNTALFFYLLKSIHFLSVKNFYTILLSRI